MPPYLQFGNMYSQQEEGAPHHAALDVVILHVEAHLAADEPACLGISHSCYGGNIKVVKFDVMKNVIKLETPTSAFTFKNLSRH